MSCVCASSQHSDQKKKVSSAKKIDSEYKETLASWFINEELQKKNEKKTLWNSVCNFLFNMMDHQ